MERDCATRCIGGARCNVQGVRRLLRERGTGHTVLNVLVLVGIVGVEVGICGRCAGESFVFHDDVVLVEVETGDVAERGRCFREGERSKGRVVVDPDVDRPAGAPVADMNERVRDLPEAVRRDGRGREDARGRGADAKRDRLTCGR